MDHLSRSLNNSLVDMRLQRDAELRSDISRITSILKEPGSRVAAIFKGQCLFTQDPPLRPIWLSPEEAGVDDPQGMIFLGRLDGRGYFALEVERAESESIQQCGMFQELRNLGSALDDLDASILSYARGMCHWHRSHQFCGFCGQPTKPERGGHVRRCYNPGCGRQHFPRTDPAIIVLTHDGDRCLLGRKEDWPEGRYSTIAGFVEPGEAAEQAVIREVKEETGVDVCDVVYHSSQPWPFPSSIMLGFHARATSQDIELIDGELTDARWFTWNEVDQAMKRTGPLKLPTRISIARRLVEDWYMRAL